MKIADAGGSILIHTFGAFFGLSVSYVITPDNLTKLSRFKDNKAVYHSDFFAMLGSLMLFLYWPSFK